MGLLTRIPGTGNNSAVSNINEMALTDLGEDRQARMEYAGSKRLLKEPGYILRRLELKTLRRYVVYRIIASYAKHLPDDVEDVACVLAYPIIERIHQLTRY